MRGLGDREGTRKQEDERPVSTRPSGVGEECRLKSQGEGVLFGGSGWLWKLSRVAVVERGVGRGRGGRRAGWMESRQEEEEEEEKEVDVEVEWRVEEGGRGESGER